MSGNLKCESCGQEIPPDAPDGQCPACVLAVALAPTVEGGIGDSGENGVQVPSLEDARAMLPEYGLERLLGSGGMGAVYLGRQTSLNRPVAVKLLPPSFSTNQEMFEDRFKREAEAMARLTHPNIVAIYDFGVTKDGQYYLVMEYVDGSDLEKMILAGGVTPALALSLVPQICDALEYAHEKGVIHRDIKPGNILVTSDLTVKVADFGLAKLFTGDTGKTLTIAGWMGTPFYMAPEQSGKNALEGEIDSRADVYSLGVVFYEMLTGDLPQGNFEPPSKKKAELDVRLDAVVLRALDEMPDRRYQKISEIKEGINALSDAPSGAGRWKKWAIGAGIAILCLVGGLGIHHAIRSDDGGGEEPKVDMSSPVWAYPDLFKRIDKVLLPDTENSKGFEIRHELYTQMLATLERNGDGHWLVGGRNCEDGVAQEFHVRKDEGWSASALSPETLEEFGDVEPDSGDYVSLTLDGGLWRYPPEPMVTIQNPRIRFVEGEDEKASGLLGSIECESSGGIWCLNPIFEILATTRDGSRISLTQALDLTELPDGRQRVKVTVPDMVDLEEEAEIWISAFIARPNAGIFRVSNVLVFEQTADGELVFMNYKHKDIYDLLERKIDTKKIRRRVYTEMAWARDTGNPAHIVVGKPYLGGGKVVSASISTDDDLLVKQFTAEEAEERELPGDGKGVDREENGYRPVEKDLGFKLTLLELRLSEGDSSDRRTLEGRFFVEDENPEAIWMTDAQATVRYSNTAEAGDQSSGELYDMLPGQLLRAGWNELSVDLPITVDLAKGLGISVVAFVGMPEAGLFQVTNEMIWKPVGE